MGNSSDILKREQALTAAVEGHGKRLLGGIRSRLRDQVEAEDVSQEVFVDFLEAYDVGTAIESLGAWLAKVAQNKVLDRFRRKKTEAGYRESLEPGEAQSTSRPDDEWTRSWLRTEIVEALEALPEVQREVFVMHELEGKSFQEISNETGVGVNTLLSQKHSAVLTLRNTLKEIYDELE